MTDFFLIKALFFVFGAMIGSFLNVLIYRIPRELDFVRPRSACPGCGKLIYWYENVPILGYLFLRGKCSKCHWKIPLRYPFVEVVTGIASLLLMPTSLSSESLAFYAFYFSIFSCFLVHFIVDLEFKILPNVINLYLLATFLVYAILFTSPLYWGAGLLAGFGGPFLVSRGFKALRGEEGLGMGDVKLWGVLGIHFGIVGIIHNIFLSCMLGSVVGLVLIALKITNRKTQIPFGPFILVVAFFQIFFKEDFSRIMESLFHLSV